MDWETNQLVFTGMVSISTELRPWTVIALCLNALLLLAHALDTTLWYVPFKKKTFPGERVKLG
jgi:hypothetical protein